MLGLEKVDALERQLRASIVALNKRGCYSACTLQRYADQFPRNQDFNHVAMVPRKGLGQLPPGSLDFAGVVDPPGEQLCTGFVYRKTML